MFGYLIEIHTVLSLCQGGGKPSSACFTRCGVAHIEWALGDGDLCNYRPTWFRTLDEAYKKNLGLQKEIFKFPQKILGARKKHAWVQNEKIIKSPQKKTLVQMNILGL